MWDTRPTYGGAANRLFVWTLISTTRVRPRWARS